MEKPNEISHKPSTITSFIEIGEILSDEEIQIIPFYWSIQKISNNN